MHLDHRINAHLRSQETMASIQQVNALKQMLLTNQRLDKLVAARVDFTRRGMLVGSCLSAAQEAVLEGTFLFSVLLIRVLTFLQPK